MPTLRAEQRSHALKILGRVDAARERLRRKAHGDAISVLERAQLFGASAANLRRKPARYA
jgi:hypothetical protein